MSTTHSDVISDLLCRRWKFLYRKYISFCILKKCFLFNTVLIVVTCQILCLLSSMLFSVLEDPPLWIMLKFCLSSLASVGCRKTSRRLKEGRRKRSGYLCFWRLLKHLHGNKCVLPLRTTAEFTFTIFFRGPGTHVALVPLA